MGAEHPILGLGPTAPGFRLAGTIPGRRPGSVGCLFFLFSPVFRFVSSRYSEGQAHPTLDIRRTFQMRATAETIESALAELRELPAQVTSWQVETGPDATDDPAVWVWVMLEDEGVDFQTRSQLREIVRNQVRHQTNDGSWVYVRFRNASEPV